MTINVYRSSSKVPVTRVQILIKLEFSQQIFKKMFKYQIQYKAVHWEPSSMRMEGRRYMTKLIVAFHNLQTCLNMHLPYTEQFRTAVFWPSTLTFRIKIPCNRRTSSKYFFSNSLQPPSTLTSRNILVASEIFFFAPKVRNLNYSM